MSTPDYVLMKDYSFHSPDNTYEAKTLPAGSFVRPIEPIYIPKEIKEKFGFHYNKHHDMFCYTRYGIIPIPKDLIRVK